MQNADSRMRLRSRPEPVDYTGQPEPDVLADIRLRRDRKLAVVVAGSMPAWIIQESIDAGRHTCTFDLVFRPAMTWLQRRYTYEAEVDALHYRGEQAFDESQLARLSTACLYRPD